MAKKNFPNARGYGKLVSQLDPGILNWWESHHYKRPIGKAEEPERGAYFDTLRAAGWKQGDPVPTIHYSVGGHIAPRRGGTNEGY